MTIQRLQQTQEKLSKRERATLAAAQGITRRHFFERLGAGGVAVGVLAAAGYGVSTLSTTPAKTEHLPPADVSKAAEALEKAGLATVQWHHPEGKSFTNPVLVVNFLHPTGTGRHDEELLHANFKAALMLADAGLTRLRCEGENAKERVKPQPMDVLGRPMNKAERRERLLDPEDFALAVRVQPNLAPLLAACIEPEATIMGAEDPARFMENTIYYNTTVLPAERYIAPLFRLVEESDGKLEMSVRNGILIAGNQKFDAKMMRRHLQVLVDYNTAQNQAPREEFVSQLDAQVILFGTNHFRNFGRLFPAHGRSVGLVRTVGNEQPDSFEEHPAIQFTQQALQILKNAE